MHIITNLRSDRSRQCDEGKPQCKKCRDHRITCDYITPTPGSHTPAIIEKSARALFDPSTGAPPHLNSTMYSMSLAFAANRLESLLQPSEPPALFAHMTPFLQSLQHFETVTYTTVGSPIAQHVVKQSVLRIALQHPYLMHATLAVSATHLKHLLPTATHPVQHTANAIAESYHWQRALHLFQAELSSPGGLGKHNMDPILSTCMLLAILSFSLDDFDPARSFVFAPPETTSAALNWLHIQSGLKGLLIELQSHIADSVWMPVFVDADDKRGSSLDERPGPDGLPPAFVALCDITPTSTIDNNPYHAPLRLLAPLLRIDAGIPTFGKLITFMGRIRPEFYDLLRTKEPRALLILGYWFALMCGVKQWWIIGRVRSECIAICTFLQHIDDARIGALLRFPASVCGVQLAKDLDDAADAMAIDPRPSSDSSPHHQQQPTNHEGTVDEFARLADSLRAHDGREVEAAVQSWPQPCRDEMQSSGIDELAGPRRRCPVFRKALLGALTGEA
jgi:hypothetical protein